MPCVIYFAYVRSCYNIPFMRLACRKACSGGGRRYSGVESSTDYCMLHFKMHGHMFRCVVHVSVSDVPEHVHLIPMLY